MNESDVQQRGVETFFADLREGTGVTRVCKGTSCALAGADAVRARFERDGPCRAVYCIGYCDRSPAALLPDGAVATGDSARAGARRPPEPTRPAVRCLADPAIVTARIGRGDCSRLAEARASGVYRTLAAQLAGGGASLIDALERSGERGRGGSSYSTAAKWRVCAQAPGATRYVIANGDEGDPGSYVDRVLMEDDPHAVLEGMLLCALAVGASHGYVFVRSEYPRALARMVAAVAEARAASLLGPAALGPGAPFDVSVVPGLGSYVCGEETALINAIEGRRGEVRLRPPYPAREGLFGAPTVVHNVETLVNVPAILALGADTYARLGTAACSGTKALCLNRGFARPGIVEVEFGSPLREVIEEAGGGADGRPLEAVLLGGPMGSVVTRDAWDVPVCPAAMAERGIRLGHGGMVALPEGTDYRALLLHLLRFTADESCGKCVPCRLGARSALATALGPASAAARARLERMLDVMEQASLCGFGQGAPGPMRQLLQLFGDRILSGSRAR